MGTHLCLPSVVLGWQLEILLPVLRARGITVWLARSTQPQLGNGNKLQSRGSKLVDEDVCHCGYCGVVTELCVHLCGGDGR